MEWHKVDLSVMENPVFNSFRSGQWRHIWRFIALSVKYDPPGVVDFYDNQIAATLGMGLEHWRTLAEEMIFTGIIRVVYPPGERRVYEIARWVLPDQTRRDSTGRVTNPDPRGTDAWAAPDDSTLPLDLARNFVPRERGNGAMTEAERQAKRRAKNTATRLGLPFDAAGWLAQQRAQRDAQTVTPDVTDPVTETSHVNQNSSNVTPPQQQETENFERETDNIPRETVTETVTETCHEAQCHHPEAARNDVVVFLSEKGIRVPDDTLCRISPHVAEVLATEVFERDGSFEAIYDQARRLPYRPHDSTKSWEGLYIASVRGAPPGKPPSKAWGGPPGYDKLVREAARKEQEARDREAARARAQAEREARDALATTEAERIAAYEAGLDDAGRADLEARVVATLPAYLRRSLEQANRHGRQLPMSVSVPLQEARRKILLEGANATTNGTHPKEEVTT